MQVVLEKHIYDNGSCYASMNLYDYLKIINCCFSMGLLAFCRCVAFYLFEIVLMRNGVFQ